ncbi:MAG: transposase family protein [Oscillospiraceae bacterium]|nr:transposase family protein [Oscillospiraceae bacterium]
MKKLQDLQKMLGDVKILRPHGGYFCSIQDVLLIVLCGSFCGLRDLERIHQWAKFPAITEFWRNELRILHIPSYSWLTQIFALIEPKSLNEKFTQC